MGQLSNPLGITETLATKGQSGWSALSRASKPPGFDPPTTVPRGLEKKTGGSFPEKMNRASGPDQYAFPQRPQGSCDQPQANEATPVLPEEGAVREVQHVENQAGHPGHMPGSTVVVRPGWLAAVTEADVAGTTAR